MRGRRIAAAALATAGLLLLPGAVMAHWATAQLVETERFVAALAPLASDPAVQDRIVTEVSDLVDEQLDISTVTAELLSGLGDALALGDKAQDALGLVSEPLAAGVRGLVEDVVGEVVRSPAFASAWASSIELLHAQTIRLLEGSPDSLLQLDASGRLELPLGPIVADVRSELIAQGVPFAAAIPEIERSIVLAELPNLALARVIYQVGVGIGVWLPIICAALLFGALLLAPRRPSMLRTLGITLAVVSALLAGGFALGRTALTAFVGPASSAIVAALYDAVLGYAVTTVVALLVLGIIVGLAGWAAGASPVAARLRARVTAVLDGMRDSLARSGFSLGRVGAWLHRERVMVRFTLIAVAALPALLNPPLSIGSILACSVLALVLIAVAEVLSVPAVPAKPARAAVKRR